MLTDHAKDVVWIPGAGKRRASSSGRRFAMGQTGGWGRDFGGSMSDMSGIEGQLDRERRRVDVDSSNFPVRELVRMMAEGELNIAPAYQRKFRWTEDRESALIESIFL